MIEQRLQKVADEIRSLKATMPISGSLINLYHYTLTDTITMESGKQFYCTVTFTPLNLSESTGLVELSTIEIYNTTSEFWSQYNPMSEQARTGSMAMPGGGYESYLTGVMSTSDEAPWEATVIANVTSTMEGTITISWET